MSDKNEPANPTHYKESVTDEFYADCVGETKYEIMFRSILAALYANPHSIDDKIEVVTSAAIKATDAAFEALESKLNK